MNASLALIEYSQQYHHLPSIKEVHIVKGLKIPIMESNIVKTNSIVI